MMFRLAALLATTTTLLGALLTPTARAAEPRMVGGEPHPLQISETVMIAPKEASPAVTTELVVARLGHPWSLAFMPDGGMLITERTGHLRIIKAGQNMPNPVMKLPDDIYVSGQAGLFDVVLAPDFERSGILYLSYAAEARGGTVLRVVQGRLDRTGRLAKLEDVKTIFNSTPPVPDDKNLGGRLMLVGDGTLLISVGDFFQQDDAQNPLTTIGKVVRINTNGTVPADNPYAGRKDVRPEIFTSGNRNIQGWAVNPKNGDVWMTEHGPKGGDEVNILKPGANYGWPLVTYGIDYSGKTITRDVTRTGVTDPKLHWVPSIAPSGLAFYTGKVKAWEGNAFAGALAGKELRRLVIEGSRVVAEESLLKDLNVRIRDVRMGPDGDLYVLTDEAFGKLLRVKAK